MFSICVNSTPIPPPSRPRDLLRQQILARQLDQLSILFLDITGSSQYFYLSRVLNLSAQQLPLHIHFATSDRLLAQCTIVVM
jgi:hypothetical protein